MSDENEEVKDPQTTVEFVELAVEVYKAENARVHAISELLSSDSSGREIHLSPEVTKAIEETLLRIFTNKLPQPVLSVEE